MTSSANIDRFTGFAANYDAVRPVVPTAVLDQLCEIVESSTPALVVDLGSGTGLSTRAWIGRAQRIVGVEPNGDMRQHAARSTPAGVVEYIPGRAEAIDLPDGCADVVSCVQAFHWMDPGPTLAEVHRCLRPGGVFAAVDCDWPPFVHWEVVDLWHELQDAAEQIVDNSGLAPGLRRWPKSGHLQQLRTTGHFRTVFELCFHERTAGDAERVARLAKSQGGLMTALKAGRPEAHQALTTFTTRVRAILGDRVVPWTYTFRARIGVR